jgi:small GTP-binding protein
MIQSVYIFDNSGEMLVRQETGRIMPDQRMDRFISAFAKVLPNGRETDESGTADLGDLKVYYEARKRHLLFLIANQMDSAEAILHVVTEIWRNAIPALERGEVDSCRLQCLEATLGQSIKVSLFGMPGVGKTTIVRYLLGKTIPMVHRPTMGVEITKVPPGIIGKNRGVVLWDIGGQPTFSSLWPRFLRRSQVVLLVTDSTLETVLRSRKMRREVSQWAEGCPLIGVGNKQDLPKALTPERVEDILSVPTQGLTALDFFNRPERQDFIEFICSAIGI